MKRLLAIAALLPLAVACSNLEPQAVGPTRTVTIRPASTHRAHTASFRQYASIVAQDSRPIRDAITELQADCNWGAPGRVAGLSSSHVCERVPLALAHSARSLRFDLKAAQDTLGLGFIGAPPAQIQGLIVDTESTAGQLIRTVNRLRPTHQCVASGGPGCGRLVAAFARAMMSQEQQLDAWRPYMG